MTGGSTVEERWVGVVNNLSDWTTHKHMHSWHKADKLTDKVFVVTARCKEGVCGAVARQKGR